MKSSTEPVSCQLREISVLDWGLFGPFRPRQVPNAEAVGCLTGVRSKVEGRLKVVDARADRRRPTSRTRYPGVVAA